MENPAMPRRTSVVSVSSSFTSNATSNSFTSSASALVSSNPTPRRTRVGKGRKTLTTVLLFFAFFVFCSHAQAQNKRRPPAGGRVAVVVDERLAAVREAPELSANLVQRLGRGRYVAVAGERRSGEGVVFYHVRLTSRTSGWLQRESVVSPSGADDDERLLRLIRGSEEFDRIARARIFLDTFPRSRLRPIVLLLFGDASEAAADRLSREAARRLDAREMEAGGAPVETYFLSYNGPDRYRR